MVLSEIKGIKTDKSKADSLSGQPVLILSLADHEACSGSLGFKQGHYRWPSGVCSPHVELCKQWDSDICLG